MIFRTVTVALAVLWGGLPVLGQSVQATSGSWTATLDMPVDRYGHRIMGDVPEWSRLCLANGTDKACVTLPARSVFEEMEPRLADIDQDGMPEAIVVESDRDLGAALVVYDLVGAGLSRVATPNIGTSFRWLAPIGIADFNGDGDMDVAYVDRPHLAKTLRVWTYRDGGLTEIAAMRGVTNHKIGEPYITSSIRTCDGRPEMILTDGARKNIVSIFFEHDRLKSRVLGRFSDRKSVDPPPAC